VFRLTWYIPYRAHFCTTVFFPLLKFRRSIGMFSVRLPVLFCCLLRGSLPCLTSTPVFPENVNRLPSAPQPYPASTRGFSRTTNVLSPHGTRYLPMYFSYVHIRVDFRLFLFPGCGAGLIECAADPNYLRRKCRELAGGWGFTSSMLPTKVFQERTATRH